MVWSCGGAVRCGAARCCDLRCAEMRRGVVRCDVMCGVVCGQERRKRRGEERIGELRCVVCDVLRCVVVRYCVIVPWQERGSLRRTCIRHQPLPNSRGGLPHSDVHVVASYVDGC